MGKLEGQKHEKLITIKDLLHNQPTTKQLDILARADRLFADKFSDGKGRYYGGILTEEEINILKRIFTKN